MAHRPWAMAHAPWRGKLPRSGFPLSVSRLARTTDGTMGSKGRPSPRRAQVAARARPSGAESAWVAWTYPSPPHAPGTGVHATPTPTVESGLIRLTQHARRGQHTSAALIQHFSSSHPCFRSPGSLSSPDRASEAHEIASRISTSSLVRTLRLFPLVHEITSERPSSKMRARLTINLLLEVLEQLRHTHSSLLGRISLT